eukprot:6196876-Pleurochrysis_carterae.AAC.2
MLAPPATQLVKATVEARVRELEELARLTKDARTAYAANTIRLGAAPVRDALLLDMQELRLLQAHSEVPQVYPSLLTLARPWQLFIFDETGRGDCEHSIVHKEGCSFTLNALPCRLMKARKRRRVCTYAWIYPRAHTHSTTHLCTQE